MNQLRMQVILEGIAYREVPENINLWPEIESRLRDVKKQSYKLSFSLLASFVALVLVSTVAYAYYRFINSDAGLEGVNEQNLIKDINATAILTVYFTPPAVTPVSKWQEESQSPPATVIAEKVIQDVTVTVNWAYADESRLAVRFTIAGLQLPEGLDYSYGAINTFSVVDLNGTNLGANGFSTAAEYKDDGSIVITANYYGAIDADETPMLDLRMHVRVGGFDAPYSLPGLNQSPEMRNIPLMGSTEFNFTVPALKGIEIPIQQTVESNGVKMRVKKLVVNCSHTEVTMCFDMPSTQDWQLWKTTIRIGESEEYSYASASNAITGNIKGDYDLDAPERCMELGFDAPYEGNSTVINIMVPYLVTSVPEVVTAERVQMANKKLEPDGIVFEYVGRDVKISQQPSGMLWQTVMMVRGCLQSLSNHNASGMEALKCIKTIRVDPRHKV